MNRRVARACAVLLFVAAVVFTSVGTVAAQNSETPSTFPRPTAEPTVEGAGPDSTAGELRAAQIGLIAVALVGAAMVVAYWRYTGREARARFVAEGHQVKVELLRGADDDDVDDRTDLGEDAFEDESADR
jgi:hypothetical protein